MMLMGGCPARQPRLFFALFRERKFPHLLVKMEAEIPSSSDMWLTLCVPLTTDNGQLYMHDIDITNLTRGSPLE